MTRNPDTESIDALLRALYETISGSAGPRDWERERRLFAPGAILVPPGKPPIELGDAGLPSGDSHVGGGAGRRPPERAPSILDLDRYIASRSSFFAANDFFEAEIARQTFRFGNIAHVLSAYEARRRPEDPSVLWRGVNSLQLCHDGERWWIVSILWDNERPDNPMPEWAKVGS